MTGNHGHDSSVYIDKGERNEHHQMPVAISVEAVFVLYGDEFHFSEKRQSRLMLCALFCVQISLVKLSSII